MKEFINKYIKCAPVGDGTRHDEMLSLLGALGNPHKRTKYIRLAGSNGKTVCAEMLVSALSRAGYRVGCLRMPIREEPRHNICIGRETVSIDEFCEHVNAVKCAVNEKKRSKRSPSPLLLPQRYCWRRLCCHSISTGATYVSLRATTLVKTPQRHCRHHSRLLSAELSPVATTRRYQGYAPISAAVFRR